MSGEGFIGPGDVGPGCARAVLGFLNAAQDPGEITAAVELAPAPVTAHRVAASILSRRAELGGMFTSLEQVAEVEQIGPRRFSAIVTAICGQPRDASAAATLAEAAEAVAISEEDFLARDAVVAVAVAFKTVGSDETSQPCVAAFVEEKVSTDELAPEALLPDTVLLPSGRPVPVDVQVMEPPFAGVSRVCASNGAGAGLRILRSRVRPVIGGFSVGHRNVTAGTVATVVRDEAQEHGFFILSNNHILANSNRSRYGDAILQPGPADGGRFPEDVVGRLTRCVHIDFNQGASNLVDAAIARVRFCDGERRVYWIGYPRAVRTRASVQLGELVQKTGRTTGYTRGRIIALHGSVKVNYPGNRLALFREQIFTTSMSAGGDSGSLVLDLDENAVGLLFAGSSTHTILNYIESVESQLGVRVAERHT